MRRKLTENSGTIKMDYLWFWLSLNCADSPGQVRKLTHSGFSLEELFDKPELCSEILSEKQGARLKSTANIDLLKSKMHQIERKEIAIVGYGSENYPTLLAEIYAPPSVLYVRGESTMLTAKTISMVGTRKPTRSGFNNMQALARDFSAAGLTVVSGMAMGLDTAAHSGALTAIGSTIAVLAGGVDNPYPKTNEKLYDSIVKSGAVISERLPGSALDRGAFQTRNRIIAGFSAVTVVSEGAGRSGASITASNAINEGREVFAVPGDIGNIESTLPNLLISEGASICTGAKSVLDFMNWRADISPKKEKTIPELDFWQTRIYNVVLQGDIGLQELADELDLAPQELGIKLTMLEINGVLQKLPGGRYGLGK